MFDKNDYTDTPTFIIPLGDNVYKFYPFDKEAVDAFSEYKKEVIRKQEDRSWAV